MKSWCACLIAAFALGLSLAGAETVVKTKGSVVQVQVEFIEVSHQQAVDLLFTDEPAESDATALRKRLQVMMGEGKANLHDTMLANVRRGEASHLASIEQASVPMEYMPWAFAREIDAPNQSQGVNPTDQEALNIMLCPAQARGFYTKDIGTTLNLRASAAGGISATALELEADLVWREENSIWLERKDAAGRTVKVQTANFYQIYLRTVLTGTNGQYHLAAVLSPRGDHGVIDTSRKVLVMVRCNEPQVEERISGVEEVQSLSGTDIQCLVHVIEMPQERAAELLAEEKAAGAEQLEKAQGWQKAGQARLFETSMIRMKAGREDAMIWSALEHRTPTEPGPPAGIPNAIGPISTDVDPKFLPQIRLPVVPHSFLMRSAGVSQQTWAERDASGRLLLSGAWGFTRHAGNLVFEDWTDLIGNRFQQTRPVYVSQQTRFGHTFISGKWILLEVKSSSTEDGKIDPTKKLVVFARADDLHPAK